MTSISPVSVSSVGLQSNIIADPTQKKIKDEIHRQERAKKLDELRRQREEGKIDEQTFKEYLTLLLTTPINPPVLHASSSSNLNYLA